MPKTGLLTVPIPSSLPRSARLLAAIGAFAMAMTGELELLFLIVFLGLFLVGLKLEAFPALSHVVGSIQPFLAAGFLFLGLLDFFYLSNSFLLSVAHFLLCIQGLRLLVLRTPRENLGSTLLSSLMILSASTLAVEWTFFLMLFIFLPAIIWTLILHNLVYENQIYHKEQIENKVDLFGETQQGQLGLLREKSLYWKRMIPSVRKVCAGAFLVAVVCCTIVFITFPRLNLRGFRGRFLQPVHKSGLSKQVNLDKVGQIFTDDSVVARVVIKPEEKDQWPGYLRGAVLDNFDGYTWTQSKRDGRRLFNHWRVKEISLPRDGLQTRTILDQDIYLESMESPVLFGASRVQSISIDRPFVIYRGDGTIERNYGDTWRVNYKVRSNPVPPYESDKKQNFKRQTRLNYASRKELVYLTLPRSMPRIRQLARNIIGDLRDPLSSAAKLSHYLSTNYKYTLTLKRGEIDDPLTRFLFETREGHCEYFASALATMFRTLNIPSRLVTGFHTQEWNDRGHYYVVRMKHAHSWVEAFIEPYGWVEFDPSPLVFEQPVGASPLMKNWSQFMDYVNLRWNRYILSYDWEKQVKIVSDVSRQSRKISTRFDGWLLSVKGLLTYKGPKEGKPRLISKNRIGALTLLTPVIVIVGLIIIGLISYMGHRGGKSSIWFYGPLIRFIEKKTGKKLHAQTLKEYIQQSRNNIGSHFQDIAFLSDEYHRLRFGMSQPTSEQEDQIKKTLSKLK